MARTSKKDGKKDRRKTDDEESLITRSLKEETVRAIVAIVFFVFALFLVLSAFEKGGMAGQNTFKGFTYLFGIGYYLLPILFFILSVSFFRTLHKRLALNHSI